MTDVGKGVGLQRVWSVREAGLLKMGGAWAGLWAGSGAKVGQRGCGQGVWSVEEAGLMGQSFPRVGGAIVGSRLRGRSQNGVWP